MAERKISFRLSVAAENVDEVKAKLEALGSKIKEISNDNAPDKLRRQFEALQGRLDPVSRAAQKLAKDTDTLNKALAAGAVSQDRYNELLKASQAAHDRMATGQAAAATSTNSMRGAVTNLSYQLQDAVVQLQSGTSAFVVFAQQGSQAASAFGPWGAVLGLTAAAAGALGGALLGLKDETNKSASEIDNFGDILSILEGRAQETGNSLDTLTDKYRSLGSEMRTLAKLALEADISKLAEKQAKDQKSAWDTIRFTSIGNSSDVPAVLTALQQLGKDKDLVAFLERLQELNAQGAIKLMRDDDVRALLETGEALRVAKARLADLNYEATPAQKNLLGYADAAREAAKAASELATAQARAGASLFTQERDLDAKIKALRGGEAAMKAFGEEQVRAAVYSKAYDAAIKAGETALDAQAEGNRLAAKAVEAYRLEQERLEAQKAASKAESQAERDAKAYTKVTAELDRAIAEQQRLAGVVGMGVEAQREANTQTKIAEEMAKAHATASTEEGKAITAKVRELEKWKNAVADAKVLESSKAQLAYAQKELSLMDQAEPVRARALQSFQIQQQAAELAKTTTAENAAEWAKLQEQIADTRAIIAYQKQVEDTSTIPDELADKFGALITEALQ